MSEVPYGYDCIRLRAVREERGLTVAEIARASGLSGRAVSFCLSGERHPRAEILPRLAGAVGLADPLDLSDLGNGERVVHLRSVGTRRPTARGRPAGGPRTRCPVPGTPGSPTRAGRAGGGGHRPRSTPCPWSDAVPQSTGRGSPRCTGRASMATRSTHKRRNWFARTVSGTGRSTARRSGSGSPEPLRRQKQYR
ncbi:helix-turn-helix domain-containing protein [Streptomyces olivaceus]|uniref:helix-turn-helix domain-containing protein n=1 Tax=Streptomyces olivaceus TaxID=47716 RepID=UPI00382E3325